MTNLQADPDAADAEPDADMPRFSRARHAPGDDEPVTAAVFEHAIGMVLDQIAEQRADQAEADRLHERAASQRTREIDRATQTRIELDRRAAAATGGDVERLRRALVATAQARTESATRCADDAIATQVMGLQAVETP